MWYGDFVTPSFFKEGGYKEDSVRALKAIVAETQPGSYKSRFLSRGRIGGLDLETPRGGLFLSFLKESFKGGQHLIKLRKDKPAYKIAVESFKTNSPLTEIKAIARRVSLFIKP